MAHRADFPAVSVLISVRDGARYLDETLESLAAQTFTDFEIVIADDHSRDDTHAVLKRWALRDPRLRHFRAQRPGLAASLEQAASVARAPLLARLDADDLVVPERLALQHREMSRRPTLGLLGSAVELIDGRGRYIGELDVPTTDSEMKMLLRKRCCVVQSSVMMQREAFQRAGGYRRGLNIAEDFDLWTRMAEVTELAALPDRLVRFRIHSRSLSARHPVRGALSGICVVAAQEARRLGRPEPFDRGAPMVRNALTLLGRSRCSFRRDVAAQVLGARLLRAYLELPLPCSLKAWLRNLTLSPVLRPLYRLCINFAAEFLAVARAVRP
jgi:glycosyltransferase involved in cell wall biosynthesis